MSKIGKIPIKIPEGVKIELIGRTLKASGPKGVLQKVLSSEVSLEIVNNSEIKINLKKVTSKNKALQGTARALVANMFHGVSEGWSRKLELVGVGFRAQVSEGKLILSVGYSHPIEIVVPAGINFKVEKSEISVEGVDKELVGQISAKIRSIRPPEPYKGKGIKYKDEDVRRKPGKVAKAVGQAA